jgi:hypothetical protein
MTLDGFHVDHIIAQKHRGKDSLDNLAWSCPHCNVNKGSDIASYDEDTGWLVALFNPRAQTWDEHFEMLDGVIIGRTPIGRVTVHILQMNEASWLDNRRLLIELALW